MIISDAHSLDSNCLYNYTTQCILQFSNIYKKTSAFHLFLRKNISASRLTEKAAIHFDHKSLPSWLTDVPYEKTPKKSNSRTFLISLPFTTREALEIRPRAVKTTSPESSGITLLILSVYFRPMLEVLNRPPLFTLLPFSVQLKSSMLSWDKIHSKVQSSPSWISVFFSRLVMPMFSSGRQKVG